MINKKFLGNGLGWSYKEDEIKLAGFDPSQNRGQDGKWGSEGGPKELTKKQKKCINYYTDDGYQNINGYLAKGKDSLNRLKTENEIKGSIKCLKNAILDLPNYEGKVYRGDTIKIKNLDDFKNNLDNNYLEFKSFLSTTKDSNQAQIFGSLTRKNEYPVIYSITSKTGKFIADYSKHKTEDEVLFMPNTRFNVLDWTDFNGRLVVDLIEI